MEIFAERITDLGEGLLPLLGHLMLWLLALAGLVGSLFPAVPGATLIWGAAVVHAVVFGFDPLGPPTLIALTVLTGLSVGGQYVVGALGAKRFGASGWGVAMAGVGMLVGTFTIPIPLVGSLLGAFLGAVAVEFPRLRRAASGAAPEGNPEEPGPTSEASPEPTADHDAANTTREAAAAATRAGLGAALGAVLGLAVEFGCALVMIGVLFLGFMG